MHLDGTVKRQLIDIGTRHRLPRLFRYGAVLLLIGAFLGPIAVACDLSKLQVQTEALAALRERFPSEIFTPGRDADVVKVGEVELGLQNLRSRLCLAGGDGSRRHAEITEFLESVLKLTLGQSSKPPETWRAAESKVRLQLMHADYLKPFAGKRVLVTKSFVPDVEIAVVLDQPNGYAYVREEDRLKWRVSEKILFEKALENVDAQRTQARLQGGRGPDPFLASEEKDGYDAVRLLLPWVRESAAKHLGNPFLAAIPNRDFLIMWGVSNSQTFQSHARENVAQDFKSQPYRLSPSVLKVWMDGRIEVVR